MNTEVFTNIILHPEILKDFQVAELKNITKKYPYFQSARALYLKGLKNNDSFRYNNELKITAAYTTDRLVLFDFITSIHFEKKSDIHKQIIEKISKHKTTDYQEIKTVEEKIIEDELFVYGQRVENFKQLQKDAIFTIATSALQEVDKRLQIEKEKNDVLEERIIRLEKMFG